MRPGVHHDRSLFFLLKYSCNLLSLYSVLAVPSFCLSYLFIFQVCENFNTPKNMKRYKSRRGANEKLKSKFFFELQDEISLLDVSLRYPLATSELCEITSSVESKKIQNKQNGY